MAQKSTFTKANTPSIKSSPSSVIFQGGEEEYYNNPLEIDAYNYEREFIISQTSKYPKDSLGKEKRIKCFFLFL